MRSLTAASRDIIRDTKAATAPRKNAGAIALEKIRESLSTSGMNSMIQLLHAQRVSARASRTRPGEEDCVSSASRIPPDQPLCLSSGRMRRPMQKPSRFNRDRHDDRRALAGAPAFARRRSARRFAFRPTLPHAENCTATRATCPGLLLYGHAACAEIDDGGLGGEDSPGIAARDAGF